MRQGKIVDSNCPQCKSGVAGRYHVVGTAFTQWVGVGSWFGGGGQKTTAFKIHSFTREAAGLGPALLQRAIFAQRGHVMSTMQAQLHQIPVPVRLGHRHRDVGRCNAAYFLCLVARMNQSKLIAATFQVPSLPQKHFFASIFRPVSLWSICRHCRVSVLRNPPEAVVPGAPVSTRRSLTSGPLIGFGRKNNP